jgi:hypothetical protein
MELASKFTEIVPAIISGLDNLEKWYRIRHQVRICSTAILGCTPQFKHERLKTASQATLERN